MTVTSTRGPAALEHLGCLGALEPGVDGHEHGAGGEAAEHRHHPLGAVEGPDGHPLSRLDPRRDERGAELAGPPLSSSVRVRIVSPVADRHPVAEPRAGPASTMAGILGQGPARTASALTAARCGTCRPVLRTVLLPYNNVSFRTGSHQSPSGCAQVVRCRRSNAHARQYVHDDENEGQLMTTTAPDVYYDPYDFEIDADPYPVWKRLRDEAPLYYNEKYDFFAVSRYDDVERCLMDWQTYSLGGGLGARDHQGADGRCPRACSSSRTRPTTTCTVVILSRVFTPRRMAAIEPQVRRFCGPHARPAGRIGGLRLHRRPRLARCPMRTIGMLLGIPEEEQEAIRDHIDEGLRLEYGEMPESPIAARNSGESDFGAYVDWRVENPRTTS